jgi:hypothetical protein
MLLFISIHYSLYHSYPFHIFHIDISIDISTFSLLYTIHFHIDPRVSREETSGECGETDEANEGHRNT